MGRTCDKRCVPVCQVLPTKNSLVLKMSWRKCKSVETGSGVQCRVHNVIDEMMEEYGGIGRINCVFVCVHVGFYYENLYNAQY